MHYIVRVAFKEGKQLTPKQKASSHFSPEPRIGAVVIRRGMAHTYTEAEFSEVSARVQQLLAAEAITLETVGSPPVVPVPVVVAPPPAPVVQELDLEAVPVVEEAPTVDEVEAPSEGSIAPATDAPFKRKKRGQQ